MQIVAVKDQALNRKGLPNFIGYRIVALREFIDDVFAKEEGVVGKEWKVNRNKDGRRECKRDLMGRGRDASADELERSNRSEEV